MSSPFFSVIIPTYNRRIFLEKAIQSVLCQTFCNFELIIIDDGSLDGTDEMVKTMKDHRINYCYHQNKGVAFSKNRGIKKAKGEYIAFLDSDDRWNKEKLEKHYMLFENDKECLISHTNEIWYKAGKILKQMPKHKKYSGHIFEKCLPLCAIGMSTAVVHSSVFEKIGMFDESMPVCEDYDFWLRAACFYKIILVEDPLTIKDGGRSDQLSHIYFGGMDKYRIISLLKLLDLQVLSDEQKQLTVQELKRKINIYSSGCFKRGKKEEGMYYVDLLKKYSEGK